MKKVGTEPFLKKSHSAHVFEGEAQNGLAKLIGKKYEFLDDAQTYVFVMKILDFTAPQEPQSRRFKGRPRISIFFRRLNICIFATALRRFGRFCWCLSSGMRSPQESTGVALGKRQAESGDFPGNQVFPKSSRALGHRKT